MPTNTMPGALLALSAPSHAEEADSFVDAVDEQSATSAGRLQACNIPWCWPVWQQHTDIMHNQFPGKIAAKQWRSNSPNIPNLLIMLVIPPNLVAQFTSELHRFLQHASFDVLPYLATWCSQQSWWQDIWSRSIKPEGRRIIITTPKVLESDFDRILEANNLCPTKSPGWKANYAVDAPTAAYNLLVKLYNHEMDNLELIAKDLVEEGDARAANFAAGSDFDVPIHRGYPWANPSTLDGWRKDPSRKLDILVEVVQWHTKERDNCQPLCIVDESSLMLG
ncbi:hypothetical protein EDB19DRAFT_1914837 [Suillus lakei]|nr:hypothetical protein EDB19DRAFT_1914837 [Suillus lakei]